MDPSELHLETLVPREDAMSDCITEDMTNLSLLTPLEFVLVDSAQVQSFFYRYYSREDAAILIKHVNDIAEYKQCFDNYFREIKAARVDRASGEVGRPYSVSAMAAPTAAMLFADFIVELSVRLIHHLDLQKERLSSLDPYFSDLKEALLSQNELIDKAMQLILAAKKEVEAPGQTFGLVPRENIILVQGHPHLKDGGRWVSADVQHPVVKYPGTPWAKFFKGTRPFFNMLNGDIHLDEVIGDDVNVDGPKVLRRVLNMFFLKQEIAELDNTTAAARQPPMTHIDNPTLASTSGIDYSRLESEIQKRPVSHDHLRDYMDIIRQLKMDAQGHIRLEYLNALFAELADGPRTSPPDFPYHWVELFDSIVFKGEEAVDQEKRWEGGLI